MERWDDFSPPTPAEAHVRALALFSQAEPTSAGTGFSALMERVCLAATVGLPVSGAVVHLLVGTDNLGVAAASGDEYRAFADMAFTTGVAPCLDAFRTRRPVLVPDLDRDQARWPGFATALLSEGTDAVFAFPLQAGAVGLGVLDLYVAETGALDEEQLGLALALATIATQLLLVGDDHAPLAEQVGAAIDHRPEVHQAQGMVMVALGISLSEAMVLLRAHAFGNDIPLVRLAHDVVAGRTDPAKWDES